MLFSGKAYMMTVRISVRSHTPILTTYIRHNSHGYWFIEGGAGIVMNTKSEKSEFEEVMEERLMGVFSFLKQERSIPSKYPGVSSQ